jgi:hypothetical protein
MKNLFEKRREVEMYERRRDLSVEGKIRLEYIFIN